MPLPLSTKPLNPEATTRFDAVKVGPSTSIAFANKSVCKISRAPLSSLIAIKITGEVVGVSLSGVISKLAEPVVVKLPSEMV